MRGTPWLTGVADRSHEAHGVADERLFFGPKAASPPATGRGYAIVAVAVASALVVAIMFLPVMLVADYVDAPIGERGMGVESAVGIAVIVRATFRRLFRAGMQGLFRTTIGAFTRTAARTVTRRLTRIALRQVVRLTIVSVFRSSAESDARPEHGQQNPFFALALGFAGLWISFRVILGMLPSGSVEQAAVVLQGMSPWFASLLIATPLLVYAAASWFIGPLFGVQVSFRTSLDGLLLQGYFTGAASFLPLTTDVEYAGTDAAKCRTAAATLSTLLTIHILLNIVGRIFDSYPFQFAAGALLIYVFVFAFPLPPLDGHHLWRRSKLLWLAVWLPVLVAFVVDIPEALAVIL